MVKNKKRMAENQRFTGVLLFHCSRPRARNVNTTVYMQSKRNSMIKGCFVLLLFCSCYRF